MLRLHHSPLCNNLAKIAGLIKKWKIFIEFKCAKYKGGQTLQQMQMKVEVQTILFCFWLLRSQDMSVPECITDNIVS